MILDEITLHNFGLYADRQTIHLTPPSSAKPVVLIGGLNGGGKTTLLDALQLCLYGPHARISNRGDLAFRTYLCRCIHRGSGACEAAIELAFRHTVEGEEEHYRLHRSWRITHNGCKEHFEVLRNGQPEPALAENWISQVDDLMPSSIAHLFLFDGEQIESYAAFSNSSVLIGAAIQNLLGLDVVDQLEKDLQVYERRKRTEDKDYTGRAEIETAEQELAALRSRSETLAQERAALRTHKIDQKRKELANLDDQFRKLGGQLYEKRADIEQARDKACDDAASGADVLRELAAGALPLLLVRDLLKSAASRDQSEESGRRAREISQTLKARDEAVLKHLRKQALDKEALGTLKAFFEKDRAEREALGDQAPVLELAPEARSDLQALLREGLGILWEDASRKLAQQKELQDQAELLRVQYESIPGADTIAEISSRREALRSEIAALETQHAGIGNEIERVFREIERKEQALTRLLEAGGRS